MPQFKRAKGVRRIWWRRGPLHVGKTAQSACRRVHAEMERVCASLNSMLVVELLSINDNMRAETEAVIKAAIAKAKE